MAMLTKEQISEYLQKYYSEHYGERDTDIWNEQPAVNVWVFERDNKYISLQCHIISGKVTEYVEEKTH